MKDILKNKNTIYIVIAAVVLLLIFLGYSILNRGNNMFGKKVKINLSTINTEKSLTKYSQNDFEAFKKAYDEGKLPKVYVTNFLFDGVGMYKPYDLEDYIERGNNTEVKPVEITVININTSGEVELTGEIKGAMIAVNTNNLKKDVKLVLNNAKIDTDSKKVPAVYAYNKDMTYTGAKVIIETLEGTKNYLEGGKLQKVSLLASDELNNFKDKYSNDSASYYEAYTKYYGVYNKSETEKILFAKVTADKEGLESGDPYYYYKASGTVSSDIDLYFEGNGYLEVTSKNKEGIESKANLEFAGGIGDYYIMSRDDGLNTTTSKDENANARNTLTINVKSLTAIVSNEAREGDAIDSNGELHINGGRIVAIARTGSDSGVDSETGTYINGGTLLATGDKAENLSDKSKQNYVVLSFNLYPSDNSLITLINSDDKAIMSYRSDRIYSKLVYSSPELKDGKYTLYSDGYTEGELDHGLYYDISYHSKVIQLGYTTVASKDDKATNKSLNTESTISGASNIFNGIGEYKTV